MEYCHWAAMVRNTLLTPQRRPIWGTLDAYQKGHQQCEMVNRLFFAFYCSVSYSQHGSRPLSLATIQAQSARLKTHQLNWSFGSDDSTRLMYKHDFTINFQHRMAKWFFVVFSQAGKHHHCRWSGRNMGKFFSTDLANDGQIFLRTSEWSAWNDEYFVANKMDHKCRWPLLNLSKSDQQKGCRRFFWRCDRISKCAPFQKTSPI